MSTNTEMPKGITRGYSTAFRQMIVEAVARALTIQELNDLDDAALAAENARIQAQTPVKLYDGAP